jgi:hypothetical protein
MKHVRTAPPLLGAEPPTPAPAPEPGAFPCALTFFMPAWRRREVIRALRKIDPDRAAALCAVLGVFEVGKSALGSEGRSALRADRSARE